MLTLFKIVIILLLYSIPAMCSTCNFNLQNYGLKCNIDLSHKNVNNIRKLLGKSDKFIALTFDDGPSSKSDEVLKILKKYESKATFFLLGERINNRTSGIIRKIYTEGHDIGNHSFTHRKMTLLSGDEQFEELEMTNKKIKNIIQKDVKWFRPPYGCHDDSLIKNAKQLNMDSVLWTVDSRDWQGDEPKILTERVVNNIHNGAIVLFHDYNRSNTIEALPNIIIILKEVGYSLVTLSDWEEKVCSKIPKLLR